MHSHIIIGLILQILLPLQESEMPLRQSHLFASFFPGSNQLILNIYFEIRDGYLPGNRFNTPFTPFALSQSHRVLRTKTLGLALNA